MTLQSVVTCPGVSGLGAVFAPNAPDAGFAVIGRPKRVVAALVTAVVAKVTVLAHPAVDIFFRRRLHDVTAITLIVWVVTAGAKVGGLVQLPSAVGQKTLCSLQELQRSVVHEHL